MGGDRVCTMFLFMIVLLFSYNPHVRLDLSRRVSQTVLADKLLPGTWYDIFSVFCTATTIAAVTVSMIILRTV